MVWNFLESHGMPCYMIVLLKLHHLLGMASAEFRLGRVTHSCEGLCQSGDRGMVSRHHEPAENIKWKFLKTNPWNTKANPGCKPRPNPQSSCSHDLDDILVKQGSIGAILR